MGRGSGSGGSLTVKRLKYRMPFQTSKKKLAKKMSLKYGAFIEEYSLKSRNMDGSGVFPHVRR